MGTDNPGIPPDGEGPQRVVYVDSFNIDIHEVTNQQFQSFVLATGYVTEVLKNKTIFFCEWFSLSWCCFLPIKSVSFLIFRQRNLETRLFLRDF